jgi:hypothetical protein
MIEEYKTGELPLYKKGQKLKYPCPDISTFNAINFQTYLMEDKGAVIWNLVTLSDRTLIVSCFF